ncbi:MAG: hypothetical protein ACJ8CB_35035 [Ktedonobacteraceae bacterium]
MMDPPFQVNANGRPLIRESEGADEGRLGGSHHRATPGVVGIS